MGYQLDESFDRVNHDVLMARVARKIKDKRMLRLIRHYLQAGIMAGGLVESAREGTPQGGLCKALHNPPYTKSDVMQSKFVNTCYPGENYPFSLHNIWVTSDLIAKPARTHPCSNQVRCWLPDQNRQSQLQSFSPRHRPWHMSRWFSSRHVQESHGYRSS
jgi:hypothetical protein